MEIFQISTDVNYDINEARKVRDDLEKQTGRRFYIIHLGKSCDDPSKKVT